MLIAHDSWVVLKENNPLAEIMHLFPDRQVPMRDPFPFEGVAKDGKSVVFWIIDVDRLKVTQTEKIAEIYRKKLNLTYEKIFNIAIAYNGFPFEQGYIQDLLVGPEGHQRIKELIAFFIKHPKPTSKQILDFYSKQHLKWIDCLENPLELSEVIKSFDPRVDTFETEKMLRLYQLEKQLNEHPVFDFLVGRVDVQSLHKYF